MSETMKSGMAGHVLKEMCRQRKLYNELTILDRE